MTVPRGRAFTVSARIFTTIDATLELRIDGRPVAKAQPRATSLRYTDQTTARVKGAHAIQLVALENTERFLAATQVIVTHED